MGRENQVADGGSVAFDNAPVFWVLGPQRYFIWTDMRPLETQQRLFRITERRETLMAVQLTLSRNPGCPECPPSVHSGATPVSRSSDPPRRRVTGRRWPPALQHRASLRRRWLTALGWRHLPPHTDSAVGVSPGLCLCQGSHS